MADSYEEPTQTFANDRPTIILRLPTPPGNPEGLPPGGSGFPGQTGLHFEMEPNPGPHGRGPHIYFTLPDLEAFIANLQAARDAGAEYLAEHPE
jgi:hypothetical protein